MGTLANRKGLTLVEMLVVIGVIGILAGVLIASFGGATDSARAAKCITNMRSLAMAVNSQAMSEGGYPLAGSRVVAGGGKGSHLSYTSHRGWISWLGEKYDGRESCTFYPDLPFYGTGKREDEMFAFTNGIFWASAGQNRDMFVCPEHARQRREKKLSAPLFSYVMNAWFGWDYSLGTGPVEGTASVEYLRGFNEVTKADKTLLFAEIPVLSVADETPDDDPNDRKADCTLQYLDVVPSSGSKKRDQTATSAKNAESIGFVHKVGTKLCAHVVFADAHTEKLVWINGGVDLKTLTAYLCRGWDVTSTPSGGWQIAKDADFGGEEEEE